ncbi:uncharacterized protein H6S33_005691 [Morchella sextelata]|jgi:hypothetical protein|uniref:uncharacterized protein n=1 Tax=Morchella sextelata TaxID=1174677 RepID=UPI001D054E9E|nr:uncharacterized protein H6S33_005691 [Morchella sextelata]KAH0613805.1 hypothetical protein H6S33_005691 [Morchella sextelata]
MLDNANESENELALSMSSIERTVDAGFSVHQDVESAELGTINAPMTTDDYRERVDGLPFRPPSPHLKNQASSSG